MPPRACTGCSTTARNSSTLTPCPRGFSRTARPATRPGSLIVVGQGPDRRVLSGLCRSKVLLCAGRVARVVELISYPVKGCAGVSAAEASLTEAGLTHDRSFMVVDDNGVFRSQRRDPRLATIRPGIGVDGEHLTLQAPGAEALRVDIDPTAPRPDVTLL